jgi:hypothetical protein
VFQFGELLSLQGMLFLLMLLGVLFYRKGWVEDRFRSGLTEVIVDLILPCNIISSFYTSFQAEVLRQSAAILAVSVAVQAVSWLLAAVCYRRQPEDRLPTLQYGTLCSNAGFLGNAVTEGCFGSQGLLLTSVYLIPQRIAMWTLGLSFFTSSKQKHAWKRAVTHPCIVAVFLGVLLLVSQWQLPVVLEKTIHSLGGCNTAMSMFLIGTLMADFSWRSFLEPTILLFSLVRLGILPLLTLLGCRLLGVETLVTQVSVILASMPAGGTTAILAAKYDRNASFAAGCVTVSTVLSMVVIPLWQILLGVQGY